MKFLLTLFCILFTMMSFAQEVSFTLDAPESADVIPGKRILSSYTDNTVAAQSVSSSWLNSVQFYLNKTGFESTLISTVQPSLKKQKTFIGIIDFDTIKGKVNVNFVTGKAESKSYWSSIPESKEKTVLSLRAPQGSRKYSVLINRIEMKKTCFSFFRFDNTTATIHFDVLDEFGNHVIGSSFKSKIHTSKGMTATAITAALSDSADQFRLHLCGLLGIKSK